ncbi:hypothetical protein EC988_009229, partial [Linderina pennispora]
PIEQNQVDHDGPMQRKRSRTRQVDNYHGQQQQQQQQQGNRRRLAMLDISSRPIHEGSELHFDDAAYNQAQMDDETHGGDTYAHDGDDLPVVTIMDETGAASTSMTAASPYLMHASTVIEDDVPKPKKPRNSFFYFRRDYHKSTNASGSRMRAKNISGAAGKIWKDMSEKEKAQYKELAAEDTKRYKQEM